MGWVIATLIIPVVTLFGFLGPMLLQQQATMDNVFSVIQFLMLFAMPAYTMRLLAEERRAGTLEILLTSAETGLASRPAFLSVGLLRDREPRVTLRALGVGGHVTPVATVPMTLAATDDFGLAALRDCRHALVHRGRG